MGSRLRKCRLFVAILVLNASHSLPALEFSHEKVAGKRAIVCRVDIPKDRLQLFLNDDAGNPLKSFENIDHYLAKRGERLRFGMNAGMFHPGYAPVGLFISEGRQIAPLNLENADGNFFLKPNGVFAVTEDGAWVVESSEYPSLTSKVRLATQSGPLLVLRNKIHPAFKPGSESKLLRNGVGVPNANTALFVITEEPVNMYEFAVFFRDVLHCPNALFLDGTVSSLHSTELHRSDKVIDLGPIIGITERR